MPTYVYECTSCNTRFERWQSFHDEPIKECPECSGATRRVYFPTGIIFKGSGWYITDSRKSNSSSDESSSSSRDKSDAKSGDKADSTSDSKVGV